MALEGRTVPLIVNSPLLSISRSNENKKPTSFPHSSLEIPSHTDSKQKEHRKEDEMFVSTKRIINELGFFAILTWTVLKLC